MAGQPAGRLPEVCAEQSSSGHGKFGACCGSAGVSGSAESLVLLCSRLLHLQMELDVSSASTKMLGSEEDGVDQCRRAAQGGNELPTFPVGSCGAARGVPGPRLGGSGIRRGLLHHSVAVVMWGEPARSPAARGSRRLRTLMSVSTALVLSPQTLLPYPSTGVWGTPGRWEITNGSKPVAQGRTELGLVAATSQRPFSALNRGKQLRGTAAHVPIRGAGVVLALPWQNTRQRFPRSSWGPRWMSGSLPLETC